MMRGNEGRFLAGVLTLYVVLALAWAFLVPPWQGPDEPGHYEYARLFADLHRPPRPQDSNPALQAAIIREMDRQDFWRFTRQERPHPLPTRFADNPFLQRSGTQLRDERPLYYFLPALLFRAIPFSYHLIVARVYSVVLGAVVVLVAGVAARVYSRSPLLRRGIPWLVAVLPMPLFIHATMNSNVLADLLGTTFVALAWTALKTPRPRRGIWIGLVLLTALGLWLKRTTLIFGPLFLLVAWMVPASPLRRHARGLLIIAGTLVLALILFPRDPGRVAHWTEGPSQRLAIRAPGRGVNGSAAFWLADTSHEKRVYIAQNLWEQDILQARGQEVVAHVQVRAVEDTPLVCLFLSDSQGRSVSCAPVSQKWHTLTVTRTVHSEATFVRVVLGIGPPRDPQPTGKILADNFVAHTLRSSGNLLRNGGADRAGWRFSRLWNRVRGLIRWGPSAVYRPAVDQERNVVIRTIVAMGILFTSFWGNFGWLQYLLPWPLYVLLAVLTLVALIGSIRAARRCGEETHCRLLRFNMGAFLLALAGNWVLAWEPGWYPQGRYMFPLLVPILAVGLEGIRAWLPGTDGEGRAVKWLMAGALVYSVFCLGYYLHALGG